MTRDAPSGSPTSLGGLSASPFFQYTFAALAESAAPEALRPLLIDALRRPGGMAFALLESYGERCLAVGEMRAARDALRRSVLLQPSLPAALTRLLALARAAGRAPAPRWAGARRVLAAAGPYTFNEAVRATAGDWFGPVGHYDALASIGRAVRPAVYLEIGVDRGASLAAAHPGARVIAVDPAPKVAPAARRGIELFETTSDDFFARAEALLPGLRVDLAFIDGLHEAGQVLRDFRETERRCRAGSAIVLHDVLPMHRVSADPVRRIDFWVGDCWRTLCLLARERPDLDIAIVRTSPSGLAVIRGLDPDSRVLFADEAGRADRLAALDLARDFVPTILRLPWLEPDEASIAGLFDGSVPAVPGAAALGLTEAEGGAVAAV